MHWIFTIQVLSAVASLQCDELWRQPVEWDDSRLASARSQAPVCHPCIMVSVRDVNCSVPATACRVLDLSSNALTGTVSVELTNMPSIR